ncbi:MAG: BamA/TamA family outer membrane protein [Verrucomicrobiales bacterium]|nr:BamA/TamA family outer membrane protein [Verrucomicrobiales bacterium]
MRRTGFTVFLMALLAFPSLGAAVDGRAREVKVSGCGIVGNLKLTRLLRLLEGKDKAGSSDANFVEDCVVVILSDLQRDGYLNPSIHGHVTREGGETRTFHWQGGLGEPLPSLSGVSGVHFEIHKGVRYYYDNVAFAGLQTVDEKTALGYFVDLRGLLPGKAQRAFHPEKAVTSARSLQQALEEDGFQQARVVVTNVVRDDITGEVDLTVLVNQGRRFVVKEVRIEADDGSTTNWVRSMEYPARPHFSRPWAQDLAQSLALPRIKEGYPDVKAVVSVLRSTTNDVVELDLLAILHLGPKVRVGEVRFLGEKKTKESTMRGVVPLEAGQPLDRTAAENGRFRLAHLGVFRRVELRYDIVDNAVRDIVYDVQEDRELEFTLLAGFGSYELLRGGFIVAQHNVWGLAHDSRLKVVQSFRSSSGDYTYTIPQFGWGSDLVFNASGLRRDEIDFTREEVSGSLGVKRPFESIATDANLRYSYQYVNAADARFVEGVGLPSARVASVILDLRHDRRDDPITPRRGYKVLGSVEIASDALGGEVDYQRIEVHGSYHWPIARDRWIHFGASHGVAVTSGDSAENLPFNKRFFLGGDSSIRGYQHGEASPLNAAGEIIGAESYLSGSIEFEQALTRSWSFVAFLDSMGMAGALEDYPFDELLFSIGGGLRWNSVIGPVRLEYGYNLNRRDHDPVGTLQFSIGFPF